MQFFLDQIVARVVAIYLFFSCGSILWRGLVERKVRYYNGDIGGLLIDWSKVIAYRDATPVRYWLMIFVWTFCVLGCAGVAIFGWFRPDN